MASEKNITMRQYNGVDYDTLYPKTIASQVDGVYNKTEILTAATAAMYGLGSDAVPDDVLNVIKALINTTQETADSKATVITGSYVGTDNAGSSNPCKLTFSKIPKLVIVSAKTSVYYTVLVNGITTGVCSGVSSPQPLTVSWTNKTVKWYATSASYQLNKADTTYQYVAIL